MALSEKESKELELLDNPQVKYLASSWGGILQHLFGGLIGDQRKERVVNLRTKMRMDELGINPKEDFNKYYEIKDEEEKRYDQRFKK
mgnify:CR=1 FL=1